jgi:magnesium-transporting ATPase (P-type)
MTDVKYNQSKSKNSMQKTLKRWRKVSKYLGKINTNSYSIIFFSVIILLVVINQIQDEKRSSILNLIKEDFENENGSKELFEKIIAFKNGKGLTGRRFVKGYSYLNLRRCEYAKS